MAEAIMICIIYVGPFILAITIGAFIMETIIPAILRAKARRRRYGKRS
jgi:hypothetical protein